MTAPPLNRYHGDTDTREHAGCLITVTWQQDLDMGPPWKEHDGHGVVLECYDEDANVMRLSPRRHGTGNWYYDLDASLELAREDQWGLAPETLAALEIKLGRAPTPDDITHAAVLADYEHLRAWCHDEWIWLYAETVVQVHTSHGFCHLKLVDALSGVESVGAGELLEQFFETATAWIDENQAAIQAIARAHEQAEDLRATLTPCF